MVLLVFLLGGSNQIHWWIECVAWPSAFEKQFNASAFMCRWNKMDAGKTCSSSCPNRFSSPLTYPLKKIEVWLSGTVMTCIACCFWNINHISTTVLFKWCIIWILTEIWTHSSTWTLHWYSLWKHILLLFPAWWGKLCFFLHRFEVQIVVERSHMVAFFSVTYIEQLLSTKTWNEWVFLGRHCSAPLLSVLWVAQAIDEFDLGKLSVIGWWRTLLAAPQMELWSEI